MTDYLELARNVLDSAPPAEAMKAVGATTETIYTTEGGASCVDVDEDDANEFYWSQIHDRDREYLLASRKWPRPCAWCGGILSHSGPCGQLQRDWKLPAPMPFGKYKGKSIAELPIEYVQWAVRLSHLPAAVIDALRERVKLAGDEERAAAE